MKSLRGDSMLACSINKGMCDERMVRLCCVAAECTNSRKSYAIAFRFPKTPKLRKKWESQNIDDNCRDVCVVRATATEYKASY